LLWKSITIVEKVQLVRTMVEGYTHNYLTLIYNYLESALECTAFIRKNRATLGSVASDEGLSGSISHQGGEVLFRNPNLKFYITGKLRQSDIHSFIT